MIKFWPMRCKSKYCMGLWEGKAFLLAGMWSCYLDSGSYLGSCVDLENESHVFRKWVTEIEALWCLSVTNIILYVNCIETFFLIKKKEKEIGSKIIF